MSEFQEYPIIDKVITHRDNQYRITVASIHKVGRHMPSASWHVVSAANYSTGKELRIAIRDSRRPPSVDPLYELTYPDNLKYFVNVGLPVHVGWPPLSCPLDIRVIRFRLDGPPEAADRIKEQMIADMVYLYMHPEELESLPMQLEITSNGLLNTYVYSRRRHTYLSHPDLFTVRSESPIIP